MNVRFSFRSENLRTARMPGKRPGWMGPTGGGLMQRHWQFPDKGERGALMNSSHESAVSAGSEEAGIPLTQRQLECLHWISKGKSSTDIGAILNISGRTVDYHVAEICQRLEVRTRMQAVAYALQKGWLRD